MAKSMLGKARTAAQKAAIKKWQAAGAAARKRAALKHGYITLSNRLARKKRHMSTFEKKKTSSAATRLYLKGAGPLTHGDLRRHAARVKRKVTKDYGRVY